jgi:hypothetical protein
LPTPPFSQCFLMKFAVGLHIDRIRRFEAISLELHEFKAVSNPEPDRHPATVLKRLRFKADLLK